MDNQLKPLTVLKQLRIERKLSRKKLAEELNMGETSIQYYEEGERNPSLDKLQQIADYFGVPIDYILGNLDYKPELVRFAFRGGLLDDMNELTEEEMHDVKDFVNYISNKRNEKPVDNTKE